MKSLQDILKLSQADECIVIGVTVETENIRWANTTATTNGSSIVDDITVISFINGAVGSVSVSQHENLDIQSVVRQSEEIARLNTEAEDKMPLLQPDKENTSKNTFAETDITSVTDPLAKVFKKAQTDKLDLFGYAEIKTIHVTLATSTGLQKEHSQRLGQIELNAKTKDRTTSIWAGQSIAAWEDQNLEELYATLVKKVGWSKNKIDVKPGKYDTLLEPSAVADLMIYAYWEAGARDADEGRTVFHPFTKEKPQVFPKDITIYSDPHEPGYESLDFLVTSASSSYESVFDNGLAIEKSDWIADGTVQSLFSPRYWAQKQNRNEKAFIGNLIFDSPHTDDLETMVKDIKNGLLVTSLWYIREVDPKTLLLTGLTRDGIFVIEDGKIIGAANNFRFNVSPIDMLKHVKKIGQSERTLAREFGDYFTLTKMPPLLIEDFNMSSKSEAV